MKENEQIYQELANRNGWQYTLQDNRPYFMKNGNYAIPDETTTEEDKELLANIISEGSSEMAKLVLMCWDNHIKIGGPCSGIKEFHPANTSIHLHFAFNGDTEVIEQLYTDLKDNNTIPNLNHMYRLNENNEARYDIIHSLDGNGITKEESDNIFATINQHLINILQTRNQKKR